MRRLSIALTVTALTLTLAVPAQAGWEEGVAAFQAGNYSAAAKEFQSVVEQSPDYANGYFMLGQALAKLNRDQDALNAFRKAYDLSPSSVQFQFALANAYLAVERHDDAARLYERIDVSSLPKNLQGAFHKNKSVAMSKSGRAGDTLVALRDTARSNPSDVTAQFNYGVSAFNSGQTDVAVDYLAKAVQLEPNEKRREAYIKALIRQAREGKGNKAAAYSKAVDQAKALVAGNTSYENLVTLGEAQLGAKQYQGAAQSFERARAKKPNDWLAHYYHSQALTALERFGPAEEALRAALAADPSSDNEKRVYRQIGFVNEKLKNFEEAKVAYTRAGDQRSVARVEENQRIARENKQIEAENQRLEELRREREKLQQELEELEEPPF